MRPLRLRARNLRTFPDLDLAFDAGVVGILGELRDAPDGADSNGAGKSTILEAIDIALFGRRSLAGYLTRGGDVDELMVELEFEHGGETYRVRRTFSARGRGKTSVDLERLDNAGVVELDWQPLTRASAKETDAFLCDLIGLSRDTFRDSSYLRQGDGGYADPDRDPRQRKELLVEAVLGRDPIWPRLAEHARTRRKDAQARLERIAGETETAQALAATVTTVEREAGEAAEAVAHANTTVEEAEGRLAEISQRYQAAREQAAARQTLEAELREAEQTLRALQERHQRADDAAREAANARDEIETLPTAAQLAAAEADLDLIEQKAAEHRDRQIARAEAQRERDRADQLRAEATGVAAQLRARALALHAEAKAKRDDDAATCQTCGQPVAAEAKELAIGQLEKLAEECAQKAADNEAIAEREAALVREGDKLLAAADPVPPLDDETVEATKAAVLRARGAQAQRARLEERIRQLQHAVYERPAASQRAAAEDALAAKQAALADLEPVDLARVEAEGAAARATVAETRRTHEAAIAVKARCDERLTHIRGAEQKLVELAAAATGLQADVDRDLLLERACGRDGIPALIIENTAIPSIEAEASRILRALGTGFQVELRTQAETKTGGLRDTLDVVVVDEDGNEADYADGCSGGEQTRIGLALRIALARLLAHRLGAESRLLALDEPSYLDAAGMTALLDVLRGLGGEFDVILLVSHVAELRDALDSTITVVKEHGVSRIAGAPVLAEAAA